MSGRVIILRTENLKKYFGEVRAIDNVNLEIYESEFISIIGPNGAGKTTLINLISRWLREDSGRIEFMGRDITKITKPYEAAKLGIMRSFQLVSVFDNLTVLDNIKVAILSRSGKSSRIFSLLDRDKGVEKEALKIAEAFNLLNRIDVPARELPHGDRKLLDVAISYAFYPKLLLLDEPTSGVSTREKRQIMETIRATTSREGITTIIVEHDMDIVFSYSDRVIVMHQGRIIADGKPGEILRNTEVRSIVMGV